MAISVPPRGIQGAIQNRQARPLNGLEVGEAVETHLISLTDKLLSDSGLLSDEVISLTEILRAQIKEGVSRQFRLQKVNVVYPKVGWNIKVRLEELEDKSHSVNAEVELDLERNVRLTIQFGVSGLGPQISSMEEEKIPTGVPDKDRQQFGLRVEAQYMKPDGTTGTVDLNELKSERRSARTVDVGSARIEGQDVSVGEEIKLPTELPEISLDEVVASPPDPPKEPPKVPLPPKGVMAKVTRPNVKFK